MSTTTAPAAGTAVPAAPRKYVSYVLGKSEFVVRLFLVALWLLHAVFRPDSVFPIFRICHLDVRPPQVDDRYKNLKPVGRGAYGLVASAEDTLTGRKARNLMCSAGAESSACCLC
jgi:hypothetical protein